MHPAKLCEFWWQPYWAKHAVWDGGCWNGCIFGILYPKPIISGTSRRHEIAQRAKQCRKFVWDGAYSERQSDPSAIGSGSAIVGITDLSRYLLTARSRRFSGRFSFTWELFTGCDGWNAVLFVENNPMSELQQPGVEQWSNQLFS